MTPTVDSGRGVPRLAVSQVSKAYPGTQALSELDLHIMPGEIHGIAGQNGAGKSTLVRILSGVERPDGGVVMLDGAPVHFDSPHGAQRAGIYTVHQELSLVPNLSVAENIYIDDLPRSRWGTVNWRQVRAKARADLKRLGFDIDVRKPVHALPIAHRQAVEIAKAVGRDAKVVIFDEPTATLPRHDVKRLFEVMRGLQASGIAIIYISHHRLMSGDGATPRLGDGKATEQVALGVEGLRDEAILDGVDITLHSGEVLGVAGLTGNGQSELAACLFGARPARSARFVVNGKPQQPKSPAHAIQLGLGLLPEERKTQGLVLGMSVANNITMASLTSFTRHLLLRRAKEASTALRMRESLAIKARSIHQPVVNLSGGNQQKVALAKWLVSGVRTARTSTPRSCRRRIGSPARRPAAARTSPSSWSAASSRRRRPDAAITMRRPG